MKNVVKVQEAASPQNGRRHFLKMSGLTAVTAGLVLTGCNDDDDDTPVVSSDNDLPGVRDGVFDLGSGDLGVLTYAYALEQLEADFYTRAVNATGFAALYNTEEQEVLTDLYNHEVIHREFFKVAITAALQAAGKDVNAHLLPNLSFDYGDLSFTNRLDVLGTAKVLEDTGVAAYNGAGRLIASPAYLVIAGKIVSVEARHASAIRSLLNPGSADFAATADAMNGLDPQSPPSVILGAAGGFITTPFTAHLLP